MSRSSRFWLPVLLLLCVPAAVYLAAGAYNGRSGFSYLLPNYLYMAAPHLLVAATTLWPRARGILALLTLLLLNLLLIAFQAWTLFVVPTNESGLAWVLYIPLWATALIAYSLVLAVQVKRGKAGAPVSPVDA